MVRNYAQEAHDAGVAALNAALETIEDDDTQYCGCVDCDVRTVLNATWSIIFEAAHAKGWQ